MTTLPDTTLPPAVTRADEEADYEADYIDALAADNVLTADDVRSLQDELESGCNDSPGFLSLDRDLPAYRAGEPFALGLFRDALKDVDRAWDLLAGALDEASQAADELIDALEEQED